VEQLKWTLKAAITCYAEEEWSDTLNTSFLGTRASFK